MRGFGRGRGRTTGAWPSVATAPSRCRSPTSSAQDGSDPSSEIQLIASQCRFGLRSSAAYDGTPRAAAFAKHSATALARDTGRSTRRRPRFDRSGRGGPMAGESEDRTRAPAEPGHAEACGRAHGPAADGRRVIRDGSRRRLRRPDLEPCPVHASCRTILDDPPHTTVELSIYARPTRAKSPHGAPYGKRRSALILQQNQCAGGAGGQSFVGPPRWRRKAGGEGDGEGPTPQTRSYRRTLRLLKPTARSPRSWFTDSGPL